jgi:hypothetical protein
VASAGPAALIVSKMHKFRERLAERAQRRLDDKDALDVLRLLQATATEALAATFVQLLHADVCQTVTDEALTALKELFTDARASAPLSARKNTASATRQLATCLNTGYSARISSLMLLVEVGSSSI